MNSILTGLNAYIQNVNVLLAFLILGTVLCLFAIWYEGRKDGFDEEKLFDLVILTAFLSLLASKFLYFLLNYNNVKRLSDLYHLILGPFVNIYALLVVAIVCIYTFSKRWKWSLFRLLDILSLGLCFLAAMSALGYVAAHKKFEFLFIFSLYILLYSIFSTLRNQKVKSGISFSIFTLVSTVILALLFGVHYLPFYLCLITISLVVIYFRLKDTMTTYLSHDFIEKMKQKLLKKDKDLQKEASQLKKEDPFISYPDRDMDNAEKADDAMEDIGHNQVEAQLSVIRSIRAQIRKALDKISKGTYGLSDVSGKPIPKERLEVYPQATTLVEEAPSNE